MVCDYGRKIPGGWWGLETPKKIWSKTIFLKNFTFFCVIATNLCHLVMICAFCGLSIASLILTLLMLVAYSFSLNYFINGYWYDYYCSYYRCTYYRRISVFTEIFSIFSSTFMMVLIGIELGCSIAAVVYSCKAYSKCCTTCLVDDCCACVGCCECDTSSITLNQPLQQHGQQMQPINRRSQEHQISQQQQQQLLSSQGANPCSALLNVVINMPGASYLVDTVRSGQNDSQAQTVSVTVHPSNGEEGQALNQRAQVEPGVSGIQIRGAQNVCSFSE